MLQQFKNIKGRGDLSPLSYIECIRKESMIRKKKEKSGPMIIDITGPDGNAFVLMGYAARLSDQLG